MNPNSSKQSAASQLGLATAGESSEEVVCPRGRDPGGVGSSELVSRLRSIEISLTDEKSLSIGLRSFLAQELPLLRKEIGRPKRGWRERVDKRLGGLVAFCLEKEYDWENSVALRELAAFADEWLWREEAERLRVSSGKA